MQKGNTEGARIHAEAAIRNQNQSLQYLKLEGRLESVAAKLLEKQKMDMVTGEMKSVTKMLGVALEKTNIEQITKTMDLFERQMEDLDIQSGVMGQAMDSSAGSTMPVDQVNELMGRVADEYNLGVVDALTGRLVPSQAVSTAPASAEEDELQARLNKLTK
mmetsp:Transcript_3377/g.6335  ORF Transcript_3377/g.6335 Transcript_3377/m.6335 type:complete len:161 (-) Transcript_3377:1315-1797(-)